MIRFRYTKGKGTLRASDEREALELPCTALYVKRSRSCWYKGGGGRGSGNGDGGGCMLAYKLLSISGTSD